jgi:DNA polymerase-3 subunit delta'
LFLGPEGSGNLALAIAYAQFLFCENKTEKDSCGLCQPCKQIQKLTYPDLSFSYPVASKEKITEPKSVDFIKEWRDAILDSPYIKYTDWVEKLDIENKQGIISVHEAEDILKRLSLKSVLGGYKILIVWRPENLHTSAANKLLKIIEEPGENTIFILVAEDYEQILPTITSRTQLIKVNRLSENELIPYLMDKHELSPQTARQVALRCDGNYSEALKMIRNDESTENLDQWFLDWMRSCYSGNLGQINEYSGSFSSMTREKQKRYLYHALTVARECLLINYADRSMVHLDEKGLEDLSRFAPFVNMYNAEDFSGMLNDAVYHIERNANSKILFTDLSFRIQEILRRKPENVQAN